jgi:5-methylcytosine-specific restriction protein A
MPTRPPQHLPPGARSAADARRAAEAQRPKVNARGYDSRWRLLRASLPHLPCARCRIPWHPGFNLDHITSRAKGGTDAFSNLEWLCPTCHSRKTTTTDGGFGHPRR